MSKTQKTVVLVQEGTWLKVLSEYLLSREFDVTSFTKAQSAIQYLESGPKVDALVTTIDLEDQFGGCNVARVFHKSWPMAPVILFTSYGASDHRVQLLGSIPSLIVARKPFRVFTLSKLIKKALKEDDHPMAG
jgi:DNA-binding NtrC family response regulator